ncbi:MAG: hypothetical protein QM638_04245 [Nocardioides sp.]|uniref:hypothetical protein n=1 Tax=Nocardioides sp. TaxID=35761 RepID=UPI0039E66A8C
MEDPTPLAHRLELVEAEVQAISQGGDRPEDDARLLELAAEEYRILERLTRPWRQA